MSRNSISSAEKPLFFVASCNDSFGTFDYAPSAQMYQLEGGYFHRLADRRKRLRRGIFWAEYDEEQKKEQEKNKPTPAIEYVSNWNDVSDV